MAKIFKTNQTLINTGFNQISGQTLSLSGNTIIGQYGTLKYSTCRHNTYTSRSVVDAEYVTGLTASIRNIGLNSQVIYRGVSGITGATNFTYNKTLSGVTVPNLCISITPPDDVCLDYILSWDNNSKQVHKILYSSAVGLTSAVNGLTAGGGIVCLGGNLCTNTTISGIDNYSLEFCNLCGLCVITTANNIVVDSRNNTGGIYLKSQSGAICSPVSNYTNSIGFSIDYPSNLFKVYDNRIGANQTGLEYAGNYSTFYTSRSLVDKSYVDTVASGLQPHPAVFAATTGDTALTGLTSGNTYIDGVLINNGDRVLIKNQVDARLNGMYILTGGSTTFVRSYDFNESSESVQGAYTFVLSGITNQNTSWVLSTPDPILIDVTPLTFTLFSQIIGIVAGHGICVQIINAEHTISVDGQSLIGNSLSWNGTTFNVDITGGTLNTALNSKLPILIFSGYTGTTRNELNLTITGATNGLTALGRKVVLGGTLTGDTTINGVYNLNIDVGNINFTGGTAINLTGIVTLQITPTGGTTTDSLLVWNNSDKKIKQISSNLVDVCNVSTTYTATTNNSFIGISGVSCVYLALSPIKGQRISIVDICGDALTNPIIVDGNGKNINDGLCSTINTNYGSITFIYNGYFWSAVAFTN